jgi:glycosyltransferase involved in cell wall biosynthesis
LSYPTAAKFEEGSALKSRILKAIGKGPKKIIAVFGVSLLDCHAAAMYLREAEPSLPIYLFTTSLPFPETEAACERVVVEPKPLKLCFAAQRILWRHHVALAVATWDTEPGDWLVKLVPFLIPWFRVLVKNENHDYFPGRPALILRHAGSRIPGLFKRLKKLPRRVLLPWLFSKAVQLRPSLPATVFQRLGGSRELQLVPRPSSGSGVLRIPSHLKGWDWRRITAIAESTQCRWLLFCHEKADTSLDDLLPLFEDRHTFVVSRQMDFRLWETTLIPRTPFRQLQPEETSQVLAPIGRVMLVDREKLLNLGIPKCSNGCAAWFILFWKAASAGWRSYAVGGDEQLKKTSAWPAEETAFVAGLLADPRTSKLTPQEPYLAQGNIAFSNSQRIDSSGRLKVLLVSPYLPFPLSHGGAVRIYNLCRELSGRVNFSLVCFREQNEFVDYAALHKVFRQVYVIDRDRKAIPDSPLPVRVAEYDTPTVRALVAHIAEREKPDFLQVEYTQLGGIRDAAPDIPAIWVEHDVTFPLYDAIAQRSGATADADEAAKWARFEGNSFQNYDSVWTMCDEDREAAVQGGAAPDQTLVVANGVDTHRFRGQERCAKDPELLFVGAFRHYPNVLAFETLVGQIMPAVWERFPKTRLRVVAGTEPERYWKGTLDHRIDLQSFVSDLRPLYAQAWVVLAPLLVSAGTNIKVLEAMACEKALVTTPTGCRGLNLVDGVDCLIREPGASFAAAILELLGDQALRERIGRCARLTAEQRFSWTSIANHAFRQYAELQRQRCAGSLRQLTAGD